MEIKLVLMIGCHLFLFRKNEIKGNDGKQISAVSDVKEHLGRIREFKASL